MTEDEYIKVSNKTTLLLLKATSMHLMEWGCISKDDIGRLNDKISEMLDKSFEECIINET